MSSHFSPSANLSNVVDTSVLQRYQRALTRNPVPNAMPSMFGRQNFLPGQTSFIRKKLNRLKAMSTPSSMDTMTGKFDGHRVDPRTGEPKMFGRGKRKKLHKSSSSKRKSKKRTKGTSQIKGKYRKINFKSKKGKKTRT